jgi:tRNA U34 2-thiouridine synthase MnmA/TrmU
MVTGHYARLVYTDDDGTDDVDTDDVDNYAEGPKLETCSDQRKDQTYFLSRVPRASFKGVVFPLQGLIKGTVKQLQKDACAGLPDVIPFDERETTTTTTATTKTTTASHTVRSLAKAASLPSASLKDSTGLCFIPTTSFSSFIAEHIPSKTNKGVFVDINSDEILKEFVIDLDANPNFNPGVFTRGQKISYGGLSTKYFVVSRSFTNDIMIVTVCDDTKHPALYSDDFKINHVNWFDKSVEKFTKDGVWTGKVRVRHGQPLCPCTITSTNDGVVTVSLSSPMRAITISQVAVLYDTEGKAVMAGGEIVEVGESYFERGEELGVNEGWSSGLNDNTPPRISTTTATATDNKAELAQ